MDVPGFTDGLAAAGSSRSESSDSSSDTAVADIQKDNARPRSREKPKIQHGKKRGKNRAVGWCGAFMRCQQACLLTQLNRAYGRAGG